jgi:2-polyprenyl-3-methyl-5-hydroxy-6-metoxy-1,4-benzoquinol methylase
MNDARREAILDNARYLREVRPVDPEEIYEYVEGQPHPAVVREVLRDHAFDLRLREREDGSFVPVEPGSLDLEFDGVDGLPEDHARRLEDLLVDEFGPGWPDGESGDSLRETIRDIKERYYRNRTVTYDRETALAYALYHLPDNYAVAQYVLATLAEHDLLGRRLRVLDVGAGIGGPALGVHDLLPDDALVEYHAVEPSAAADVFESLLADTRREFRWGLHRETAEAFDPDGVYDVVLFANVLSELDDPVAVAARYLDAVAADGSFGGIAPADRETTTTLRRVERELEDRGAGVWGPQVRLWPGETPRDRGWSFVARPDLDVPAFQRRLDEPAGDTGEFVNVDVQYAYAVLRHDDARMVEFTPDRDRFARFADAEEHVTERVDCVALKLSGDLSDGAGANPLFKVSDGSEAFDHYAVLTQPSSLNDDLGGADYGDLLAFENVLVLWNDDEAAYNLVVDAETVVDAP